MLTWSTLKTEILAEDDLSEEVFASQPEIIGYINDALRSIEKDIHAIGGQKYFETSIDIPVISGVADYSILSFLANIYGFKITAIHCHAMPAYEIKPIQDKRELLMYATSTSSGNRYKYKFFNNPVVLDPVTHAYASGGPKITFYPTPVQDVTVRVYFIRSVSLVVDEYSVIEIPEAKEFLKGFVIEKALNKERLAQDSQESAGTTQKRVQLIESLTTMFADDNNELIIGFDFYGQHT